MTSRHSVCHTLPGGLTTVFAFSHDAQQHAQNCMVGLAYPWHKHSRLVAVQLPEPPCIPGLLDVVELEGEEGGGRKARGEVPRVGRGGGVGGGRERGERSR